MGTYIMLSTLTDDGSKTLKEKPNRLKEVNQELEQMGVKILNQFATLGPYDFVNILEAPDNETIAKISVEMAARGTVRFLTLPAIPIDQFIENLKGKPLVGGERKVA
ncbi:MAG TPA: GYD domain-containing protein [Candidatus Manganitrophaceae bacterium]|nr:GYD domain-containing protein [Candidatus Manganitrophaceae bacterium]